MQQLYPCILFIILCGMISSCSDCIKGDGNREREYRTPGDFTSVHSDIVGRITVEEDSTLTQDEVTIEAQLNVADNIETEVSQGVLTVSYIDCMEEHKDVIIAVKTRKLESVRALEQARIETSSIFRGDSINLSTSGNGRIDFVIDTRSIRAAMGGSGEISLHGQTERLHLRSSGPGSVRNYDCPAQRAFVENRDAGNSYVRITQFLEANITGTGNVFYRGSGAVTRTGNGDGELISERNR